ncbi:MAG: hypothetical protein ACFFEL_16020 [Candidatus Thorarchaeota archaeon]
MSEFKWERDSKIKPKISEVLVLEKDEIIMRSWEGTLETFEKTIVTKGVVRRKHKVVEAKGEEVGHLIITNRRLLWVSKRGRFGKTHYVSHVVPFDGIRSISGGGKVKKYISLIDSESEYVLRLSGKYRSLDEFRNIVLELKEEREKEIEAEKQKERVHVMIDFTSLSDHMKEGGLSLQTVKCPECGASLKLPESGNQMTCEHCGCTVHAQDIFEKIQDLIG